MRAEHASEVADDSAAGSAPVWPVADVGATVRWFEQNFGFASSTHPQVEPFEWASLVRDNVEIMVQRVAGYE